MKGGWVVYHFLVAPPRPPVKITPAPSRLSDSYAPFSIIYFEKGLKKMPAWLTHLSLHWGITHIFHWLGLDCKSMRGGKSFWGGILLPPSSSNEPIWQELTGCTWLLWLSPFFLHPQLTSMAALLILSPNSHTRSSVQEIVLRNMEPKSLKFEQFFSCLGSMFF